MSSSRGFIFVDHGETENLFHYLCRWETVTSLSVFEQLINDLNKYLLQQYDPFGDQCIHIATARSTVENRKTLELLIEWGADINSKNKNAGDTPLHIATSSRNYDLVAWLCEQPGIDINICNFHDKTPWDIAYDGDDYRMIQILAENGALSTTERERLTSL